VAITRGSRRSSSRPWRGSDSGPRGPAVGAACSWRIDPTSAVSRRSLPAE
jgi:hypothetical protein